MPFALFRSRNYTLVNGVGAAETGGIFVLVLLISLYCQSVLGVSALSAGLILVPASVMAVLLAPFSGRMADRFEAKYILLTGMLVQTAGITWIALLMSGRPSWLEFLAPMMVVGIGNGCVVAPLATVAMLDVDPALVGAASGVFGTIGKLGGLICTAAAGGLVQSTQEATGSASTAVRTTMVLPIAVMATGALICLLLQRDVIVPRTQPVSAN